MSENSAYSNTVEILRDKAHDLTKKSVVARRNAVALTLFSAINAGVAVSEFSPDARPLNVIAAIVGSLATVSEIGSSVQAANEADNARLTATIYEEIDHLSNQ